MSNKLLPYHIVGKLITVLQCNTDLIMRTCGYTSNGIFAILLLCCGDAEIK